MIVSVSTLKNLTNHLKLKYKLLLLLVEECQLSVDECLLNDHLDVTYDVLCIKHDSFFYETCVAKVDNVELS